MKDVDADYYGYMDDDDGILIPLEEAEEAKAIARTVDEWRAKKEAGISEPVERRAVEDLDPDIYHVEEGSDDEDGGTVAGTRVELDEQGQPKYIAHVPVPSQQEIEEALLRRKKMEMLLGPNIQTWCSEFQPSPRLNKNSSWLERSIDVQCILQQPATRVCL